MPRPNFFVIGSEKSGTTSLCKSLAAHPEVFLSTPKEPHFFSTEEKYIGQGIEWYLSLFENATEKACGEGSVTYSYESRFQRVIPRISQHCPESKFIYIVREPVRRIQSIWRQSQALGFVNRKTKPLDWLKEKRNFLESNSLYYQRILPFIEQFGSQNVFVAFMDDMKFGGPGLMGKLFDFLDVDPAFQVDTSHANQSRLTRDSVSVTALRKIGFVRSLAQIVPEGIKHKILQKLRFPIQNLSDELIRQHLDLEPVKIDCRKLFALYGKPKDFWSFDS